MDNTNITTVMIFYVTLGFCSLVGFFIFLAKRANRNTYTDNGVEEDLLGTGSILIATQIKRDIGEIRMEVDKLMDHAIRLNESSREILERLRDQAKDEPITSSEYKMLVRQILKEVQAVRNTNTSEDYEYLMGRIIKILSQLAS